LQLIKKRGYTSATVENDYKEDRYYAFGNPSIEVIEQTKKLPPKTFFFDVATNKFY